MERSAIGVETFPPLDGMMTSVADPRRIAAPYQPTPTPTTTTNHHRPRAGDWVGAPKGAGGTGGAAEHGRVRAGREPTDAALIAQ